MCDNGNMLCRSWPKFLLLACVVVNDSAVCTSS